jgi:hypothetical protein
MLMTAELVTGKVVGKCFLNGNLQKFFMKIASIVVINSVLVVLYLIVIPTFFG